MKTILVTAYAINPYKGSEDGAGWNNILQIAKNNRVIAITRENNIPHIEAYIEEFKVDSSRMEFHGFDLPKWARFWKRGQNGAMLYFYLWQMFIVGFIKKNKLKFDIAHNLNFHTDWVPTFLWKLKKPTVWGPVGHHPHVPKGYYNKENSSSIDRIKNDLIWFTKKTFWLLDFNFHRAKKRTDHILCMNSEAMEVYKGYENKLSLCASVGSTKVEFTRKPNEKFRILSAGRIVPLKGFDITLKSFHKFYETLTDEQKLNTELILIGKGKMTPYLENYIAKHKLEQSVKIINWLPREELLDYYTTSSLYFFPSHEGAGMVVLEALSYGVPILCFDNSGPGEFSTSKAGTLIPYSNYEQSVNDFAEALSRLHKSPEVLKTQSEEAVKRFNSHFLWEAHGEIFEKIYANLN